MNKIRIIDLLNMISKGEETPNKFKYDELIFTKRFDGAYFDNNGDELHDSLCIDLSNLNDEVEIIEEDKEIEKIITFYDGELEEYIAETKINNNRIKEHYGSPYEQMIINKINELIDKVNSLEKNK